MSILISPAKHADAGGYRFLFPAALLFLMLKA